MFAQLIVGAPGAGKTTYCAAAREFLQGMGRNVAVVNLDPANDGGEYDVDIRDLVQLSEVMERLQLGPNGGLLFCLEYLEEHLSWLKEELERFQGHYILFDCPGQVELFTHHNSMRTITQVWEREWKMRICVVNLVDSHCCSDAGKFVSALLTSMSTMMQLELPHINVLSKIDLAEAYGQLPFNLEYAVARAVVYRHEGGVGPCVWKEGRGEPQCNPTGSLLLAAAQGVPPCAWLIARHRLAT